MINLRSAIFSALTTALGSTAGVYFFYPDKLTAFPAVSFYESSNVRNEQADTQEYLTEITYQADVWAKTLASSDEVSEKVNEAFTALGFRREQCADVHDPACLHRTMRYRALLDPDLNVFQ